MARLLLVEDDARIAAFLRRGLEQEGYSIVHTTDGRSAQSVLDTEAYDLVILDRMLPDADGLDVCRALRASGNRIRVLMLTAKDTLQDKVDGLKDGADDYLTKPFSFEELLARVGALLRRSAIISPSSVLEVADLRVDQMAKTVRRGQREIALTVREFDLLVALMESAGAVLSREDLLSRVWNLSFEPGTNVVDVYIRYLRRKIDQEGETSLIKTVRGFGYSIAP